MQSETRIPLLDRVFDPEYRRALNPVTLQVPLLRLLYLFCIPLSKALVRLGCSPTSITHVSNLLAIGSVAALIWAENPWLFPALWLASLFFDIADGIVARKTGRASAVGSFYDHMSDQVKVIALFLGTGLRYETATIWILCYTVGTGFLFMTVVNQVLALRSLRLSVRTTAHDTGKPPPGETRGALRSFMHRYPMLLGIYRSIFFMYGNSMLLILPLAFGETWAIATLVFFGVVTLRSLVLVLVAAVKVNRQFAHAGVPWK